MARTLLSTITPTAAGTGVGAAGTEQNSDVANGNYITPSLQAVLIARNSTGGALVVTIKSPTPDAAGRTIPDVTKSLGANETWCFRIAPGSFTQTDGTVWIDSAGTAGQIKYQVINLA